MGVTSGLIGNLATLLGAPEPALRLLISILAGYPLAGIYHKCFKTKSRLIKNLYFSLTGISLNIFNYGLDVYHSFFSVLITFILLRIFLNPSTTQNHTTDVANNHNNDDRKKSQLNNNNKNNKNLTILILLNFFYHMSYLLIGYYFTESDNYDIKWTMPHCVLVLRLIGLMYDICDGQNSSNSLSTEQKLSAIKKLPSFLDVCGYSYFPASCLVGPQFQYKRYNQYLNNDFLKYKNNFQYGLQRFTIGAIYLLIKQLSQYYIDDQIFFDEKFQTSSFTYKLFILCIWGKLSLYKYISCWLLSEGAAICFGLTFVDIKENGEEDWSGLSNCKLLIFETASKLGHYVLSFNVNTNNWISQYIYKRLKFLNNRQISYGSALIFLAIWHGFHTGYYMCFFLEYLVITFEKQFEDAFDKLKDILINYPYILDNIIIKLIILIIRKIYTISMMGWCLIPFIYLNYIKWLQIYSIYSYIGLIFLFSWFFGRFLIIKLYTILNKNHNNDLKTN